MNRTKDGALQVLREVAAKVRPSLEDSVAKELLTPELVGAVLDSAWQHQFDEDRSAFKSDIRQLITDAIEQRMLGEAKA